MIGLDTNVLVRFIMQDDPVQSPQADQLIGALTAQSPGFVPLPAVIELNWVLSSCFKLSRAQVAQALQALLQTQELVVDRAEQVAVALRTFKAGSADLPDCLIHTGAMRAGCEATMTFDVQAAKSAGMTLVGSV